MEPLQGILFFDVSMIIFMVVLAYLSSRLGEALKIPAFYKFLYSTTGCIIGALILDVLASVISVPIFLRIALIIRFLAGIIACIVILRYWMWVFSEFFKN